MKYRILKRSDYSYRVQYRSNWWPFWTTDSRYESYDEPVKRERRGGFFMDIISVETVYGHHTNFFGSYSEAKARIKTLKGNERDKRNRKPDPKPQVVHTE